MAEIKRKFKIFLVGQEKREQRWLEQQHRNGWKLLSVQASRYTFEKCEPEEVVYRLDYNPEGVKNQKEYIEPYEAHGWEYMDNYADYLYFCKPKAQVNDEDDIFHEMSDAQVYARVFKGKILPLLIIFCICVLPQLWLTYSQQRWKFFGFWVVMAVLYVILLTTFGVGYWKNKDRK